MNMHFIISYKDSEHIRKMICKKRLKIYNATGLLINLDYDDKDDYFTFDVLNGSWEYVGVNELIHIIRKLKLEKLCYV